MFKNHNLISYDKRKISAEQSWLMINTETTEAATRGIL